MRIAFLLPSNTISGGVFSVFRHASYLRSVGHEITIGFVSYNNCERAIYPGLDGVELLHWRALIGRPCFDAVIATWWETVALINEINSAHYFYFVQGFEDEFYPEGSSYAKLALDTYKQPIHFIAVSQALCKRLQAFGHEVTFVPTGIELERFTTTIAAIPRRGRIRALVEGLPHEERKGVRQALDLLSGFEELEVVYISPEGTPDFDARIDYFFQAVPYEQMPSLIKSCDFIVKLSRTESFALPVLEMFACGGTAVISDFKGCDEYILHNENALVVPFGDMAETRLAIQSLISNAALRLKLSTAAVATAQNYELTVSGKAFERALAVPKGVCKRV